MNTPKFITDTFNVILVYCGLAFACAAMAAPTNRLLILNSNNLFSSTYSGATTQTVPIDQRHEYNTAMELTELDDGRIALINQTQYHPKLSIYDQKDNSWSHFTISAWKINNNPGYNSLVSIGSFIYSISGESDGDRIIKINANTGAWSKYFAAPRRYGLSDLYAKNGYLYALWNWDSKHSVEKIDPETMSVESVTTLSSQGAFPKGFAVDDSENYFTFGSSTAGVIDSFDSSGSWLKKVDLGYGTYFIGIEVDSNGKLVLSTDKRSFYMTDSNLTNPNKITLNVTYPDVYAIFTSRPFSELPHPDNDKDGIDDYLDNCKKVANSDQLDTDNNGTGDACEFDITTFMPPILAAVEAYKTRPEWGVINYVCCPTSSATLDISLGSATLSSTIPACGVNKPPSFSGYEKSKVGNKNFSALLSSSTCGDIPFDFEYAFEKSKKYRFELRIVSDEIVLIPIVETIE